MCARAIVAASQQGPSRGRDLPPSQHHKYLEIRRFRRHAIDGSGSMRAALPCDAAAHRCAREPNAGGAVRLRRF